MSAAGSCSDHRSVYQQAHDVLAIPKCVIRVTRPEPAKCGRRPSAARLKLPHGGEKDDLADRLPAAQDHHQAVDADPDPAGWRHPVLERLQERLVVRLRLDVAGSGELPLLLEAGALLVGVVEL